MPKSRSFMEGKKGVTRRVPSGWKKGGGGKKKRERHRLCALTTRRRDWGVDQIATLTQNSQGGKG